MAISPLVLKNRPIDERSFEAEMVQPVHHADCQYSAGLGFHRFWMDFNWIYRGAFEHRFRDGTQNRNSRFLVSKNNTAACIFQEKPLGIACAPVPFSDWDGFLWGHFDTMIVSLREDNQEDYKQNG